MINCNFTNNTAEHSGGAVYFFNQGTVINCNFINNTAYTGGAVNFHNSGTVINCNFTNNTAEQSGGALNIWVNGNVTNCNFVNNTASQDGGAVCFSDHGYGNVANCNFVNNTASECGGAVCFGGHDNSTVSNSNFADNHASRNGGAVYFKYVKGNVTNCNFVNNSASIGGAIYSFQRYTTADTCIFKRNSPNNLNTVIYLPTLNVDNFTTVYGSGEKLIFDLKTNSGIPVTNGNISIRVYFKDNGKWVSNYRCLSGEGWIPDLPVGSYIAVFDTEYADFKQINRTITITLPNVKYSINVTSITTTNNRTVNITAKTNVPKDILWDGKLLIYLTNGTQIKATYGTNGTWWAVHKFDAYGDYQVNATYQGLDNITITNATIRISKTPTNITVENETLELLVEGSIATGATLTPADAGNVTYTISNSSVVQIKDGIITAVGEGTAIITVSFPGNEDYAEAENKTIKVNVIITVNKATSIATADVSTTYNINKDLVITLKDSDGNPLTGASVTVDLNGAKTYTTDKNGQIKVSTKGLKPKKYTAKITFNGNTNYAKSTKDVKVTVKKATPKLTAKKKTFKRSLKVKKYIIVLKNNVGKAIKKAKVTIKIGKKTFKAKTNSKGKATFKIKKVTKKRTYKAKVTFKGSAYYNKVTKKVKIRLR